MGSYDCGEGRELRRVRLEKHERQRRTRRGGWAVGLAGVVDDDELADGCKEVGVHLPLGGSDDSLGDYRSRRAGRLAAQ